MSASAGSATARRAQGRREELLDAAERRFRDEGVAATTVAEITQAAGVAKGTFYLYFDSKDHVVAGLQERLVGGMAELFVEALEELGDADFLDLADEVTALVIDYWIAHRDIYRAIIESGSTRETTELLASSEDRVIVMLKDAIDLGIEQGVADVADPRLAAEYIYFGCKGTNDRALLAPGPVERDRQVSSAQQIVRKILRP